MRIKIIERTTLGRPGNHSSVPRRSSPKLPKYIAYLLVIPVMAALPAAPAEAQTPLRELLRPTGFKIAYESYVDGNSDIFVMNADGSNPVKLTDTPNEQEHYPQVSPDATKICFVSDVGEGRDTVRSLYVMDIDGKNRKKIADHAREPFWSPDGKIIGFLPQEFPKFDVIDFSTKGMKFYDLATGEITPHVNSTNLLAPLQPELGVQREMDCGDRACRHGRWPRDSAHRGARDQHHQPQDSRLPALLQPGRQAGGLGSWRRRISGGRY